MPPPTPTVFVTGEVRTFQATSSWWLRIPQVLFPSEGLAGCREHPGDVPGLGAGHPRWPLPPACRPQGSRRLRVQRQRGGRGPSESLRLHGLLSSLQLTSQENKREVQLGWCGGWEAAWAQTESLLKSQGPAWPRTRAQSCWSQPPEEPVPWTHLPRRGFQRWLREPAGDPQAGPQGRGHLLGSAAAHCSPPAQTTSVSSVLDSPNSWRNTAFVSLRPRA